MADDPKICLQNAENNFDSSNMAKINVIVQNTDPKFDQDLSKDISCVAANCDNNVIIHSDISPTVQQASDSETCICSGSEKVKHVFCHVGLKQGHSAEVIKYEANQEKVELLDEPSPKRLKLQIPQNLSHNYSNYNAFYSSSPPAGEQSEHTSPEGSKRRRIQHDYRRLSCSGYVDDYEKGKDTRFTSPTDADILPISPGR
ncbi:unnamed protein product, partial [Lymnaea stagnalis]